MNDYGQEVNRHDIAVRPALHLKLSSVSSWSYAGTVIRKNQTGKSSFAQTETKKAHRDSFVEESKDNSRIPDLLQYIEEMEGEEAEAVSEKQSDGEEPEKEENVLFPCTCVLV